MPRSGEIRAGHIGEEAEPQKQSYVVLAVPESVVETSRQTGIRAAKDIRQQEARWLRTVARKRELPEVGLKNAAGVWGMDIETQRQRKCE